MKYLLFIISYVFEKKEFSRALTDDLQWFCRSFSPMLSALSGHLHYKGWIYCHKPKGKQTINILIGE